MPAAALLAAASAGAAPKPHVLYVLTDDYGWADAGWHRPPGECTSLPGYYLSGSHIVGQLGPNKTTGDCCDACGAMANCSAAVWVNDDAKSGPGTCFFHDGAASAAKYSSEQRVLVTPSSTAVPTAHLEALVREGVELDRHYVYKFCSPTRSAIQSGRNPVHVNAINVNANWHNPNDPASGYAAVPPNMTGMAEHLSAAGYETHMYGKWDAGMATMQQSPRGRGYQHDLHYFWHANDYWTSTVGNCGGKHPVDLWSGAGPAVGVNNAAHCSQGNQAGCVYEDQMFADRVYAAIDGHDAASGPPLFVFWAPHIVHTPLQVPQAMLTRFSFIPDSTRQFYHAMVAFVDEAVGNATAKLKAKGMWGNTLMIFHADNGGPIYNSGNAGANNYPLRGGKMTNWEGGIRVNAFVSGGFVPAAVRGTKQAGLVCGWDWYATLAGLAGVDPTDHRAAAAGLPPIDSIDVWPLLSGQVDESPRKEHVIGDVNCSIGCPASGQCETWGCLSTQYNKCDAPDGSCPPTTVGGLIRMPWKIVVGVMGMATWTGPAWPNVTKKDNPNNYLVTCGNTPDTGCLFDIAADPTEHSNVAAGNPDVFHSMLARVIELNSGGLFSPARGHPDSAACDKALGDYGGFWGPWVDV